LSTPPRQTVLYKGKRTAASTEITSSDRPQLGRRALVTGATAGIVRAIATALGRDGAGELFYAEGVRSVGIDRVIERAGVAKASLYSTFGSKEQLVCAYLDAQAQLFRTPDYRGCAFTAAAAEAPAGGRVDEAAESYRRDIRALFTELAATAGARDPVLLASQLQSIYDGGGLAAKMDRDPAIAASARAAATALIAAAITPGSK
jgi:hypothetical protein